MGTESQGSTVFAELRPVSFSPPRRVVPPVQSNGLSNTTEANPDAFLTSIRVSPSYKKPSASLLEDWTDDEEPEGIQENRDLVTSIPEDGLFDFNEPASGSRRSSGRKRKLVRRVVDALEEPFEEEDVEDSGDEWRMSEGDEEEEEDEAGSPPLKRRGTDMDMPDITSSPSSVKFNPRALPLAERVAEILATNSSLRRAGSSSSRYRPPTPPPDEAGSPPLKRRGTDMDMPDITSSPSSVKFNPRALPLAERVAEILATNSSLRRAGSSSSRYRPPTPPPVEFMRSKRTPRKSILKPPEMSGIRRSAENRVRFRAEAAEETEASAAEVPEEEEEEDSTEEPLPKETAFVTTRPPAPLVQAARRLRAPTEAEKRRDRLFRRHAPPLNEPNVRTSTTRVSQMSSAAQSVLQKQLEELLTPARLKSEEEGLTPRRRVRRKRSDTTVTFFGGKARNPKRRRGGGASMRGRGGVQYIVPHEEYEHESEYGSEYDGQNEGAQRPEEEYEYEEQTHGAQNGTGAEDEAGEVKEEEAGVEKALGRRRLIGPRSSSHSKLLPYSPVLPADSCLINCDIQSVSPAPWRMPRPSSSPTVSPLRSGSGGGSVSPSLTRSSSDSKDVAKKLTFYFQIGLVRDVVSTDPSQLTLRTLKELACSFIASKFPDNGLVRLQERLHLFIHDSNSPHVLVYINSAAEVVEDALVEIVLSAAIPPEETASQMRPHQVSIHSYRSPTFCDYCGDMLFGLVKQGVQCDGCGKNFHKRCLPKDSAYSEADSSKSQVTSASVSVRLGPPEGRRRGERSGRAASLRIPHTWEVHSFAKPTFCNACKKLLVGFLKQGLQCRDCKLNVHKKVCPQNIIQDCSVGENNGMAKSPTVESFGAATSSTGSFLGVPRFGGRSPSGRRSEGETTEEDDLSDSELGAGTLEAPSPAGDGSREPVLVDARESSNIPLQRIVQSVRHTKKKASQVLKEGWMVHFTNREKEVKR
ncbi:unnamed protein product [Cyprideis torosa]|uniref:Phorbol-ester/DAG-type domain-containing protein n=1 Tax=Cyprideis torosa TaxID=163714 RepID=A0A7R8WC34_9CRUS|nr:unnamed protein product [Cyprideis torosa]CAG0887009.1 unnamed protein product [Cyprideis torosa]